MKLFEFFIILGFIVFAVGFTKLFHKIEDGLKRISYERGMKEMDKYYSDNVDNPNKWES